MNKNQLLGLKKVNIYIVHGSGSRPKPSKHKLPGAAIEYPQLWLVKHVHIKPLYPHSYPDDQFIPICLLVFPSAFKEVFGPVPDLRKAREMHRAGGLWGSTWQQA
jgi:hypothetical protein